MDLNQIATDMNNLSTAQSQLAVVFQGYCNAVSLQSDIQFPEYLNINDYADKLNVILKESRKIANNYINTIFAEIIHGINNINSYYGKHQSASTSLARTNSIVECVNIIQGLLSEAEEYEIQSHLTSTSLSSQKESLISTNNEFNKNTNDLNTLMGGDSSILASNQQQISSIDNDCFNQELLPIPDILEFSSELFAFYIGPLVNNLSVDILAGGIICQLIIANSTFLLGINEKRVIIQLLLKNSLNNEIKLANGIFAGLKAMETRMTAAVNITMDLSNIWPILSANLKEIINELQEGMMTVNDVKSLFTESADKSISTIIQNTTVLVNNMNSIKKTVAAPGETLFEILPN